MDALQPSRRRLLWFGLSGVSLIPLGVGVWAWGRQGNETSPVATTPDDVCIVAPPTPHNPRSGVALLDPRTIPSDARCPVCGMYPARSLEWAAQLIFDNGDTHFFDSPLSMFTYLANVGRYAAGRELAQVVRVYVTDAAGGGWLVAQEAVFVDGSGALGPMRAGNLPAFASTEAAQLFVQQRGGTVLRFDDVTPKVLNRLGIHRPHRHTSGS